MIAQVPARTVRSTGSAGSGDATTQSLDGTVERVTFYNPQTSYSVVKLRVRGRREPVSVVGPLPAVQPGERLALTGRWEIDPQHGAQFRPQEAEVHPPASLDDVVAYLGSGLVRQLGPVLARRIVETFGERTMAVLDGEPWRVREVPGIGPRRAQSLASAWKEHRALRAVAAFLSDHGVNTAFAPRLVRAYGDNAAQVIAANPYRLVSDVSGFGFAAADRLGTALGVRTSSPVRLQAALHAALLRAADQGHTRTAAADLIASAAQAAKVAPDLMAPTVQQLRSAGVLTSAGGEAAAVAPDPAAAGLLASASAATATVAVSARTQGRMRIYEPAALAPLPADSEEVGLAGLVWAEQDLAGRLAALAQRPVPAAIAHQVDVWLAREPGARALSAEQRAAVRTAATSSCFVLTGGPGVGKTTTLRVLVACLHALGRDVALAAPTGKAARRLGDVAGLEAQTLHRLLGAGPEGFRFNAWQPLPHDALIVDEASMLDTTLARAAVAAVGPRAQLILVGDADQLPSVGPGQVLRDLLASEVVPAARLTTVFRQAAQSEIVRSAHRIREGLVPTLAPPAALLSTSDLVFVPAPAGRVSEVAAEWAAVRLPRVLAVSAGDVQALAPLNRVTQAANGLLQARLNPPAESRPERPHGALPLRVGDRVIQTRNNYSLGVVNGDTGLVAEVTPDGVQVDFGSGRMLQYAPADLLDLDHAYCLTVHRAQGSEWPGVVIMASSAFGPMLTRNLLYTALTRARRAAVIVGDTAAVERAVAETRDQARRTGLVALLREATHAA